MPESGSLLPARDQALALLDDLCQDSLDIPLSTAIAYPEGGVISAKFKWLHDLIVKEMNS